jgi:Bacterial Ig domain/PQQ-like domain
VKSLARIRVSQRGRRFPLLIALVAVLFASGCGPVDWLMFRFGPDHTGFTPDTSITKDAVQGSMVLNWTASTSAGVNSSPAVANGVVYVGSADHKLYAFGLEKVPPTTSVLIPSNSDTLSGTTTLDAKASDNVKVSRVDYHLTGGSYNDKFIGFGKHTYYGWVYDWNTTSVPNGPYTLNSVAFDPAGNSGRSANVSITVQN